MPSDKHLSSLGITSAAQSCQMHSPSPTQLFSYHIHLFSTLSCSRAEHPKLGELTTIHPFQLAAVASDWKSMDTGKGPYKTKRTIVGKGQLFSTERIISVVYLLHLLLVQDE